MFKKLKSTESPLSKLQCFTAGLHREAGFWQALHLPSTFLQRGRDGKIKGLFVAPTLCLPLVPTLQKVIILTIQFNWDSVFKKSSLLIFPLIVFQLFTKQFNFIARNLQELILLHIEMWQDNVSLFREKTSDCIGIKSDHLATMVVFLSNSTIIRFQINGRLNDL